MKIEAGKYYRTRDGRKVGPMQHWPHSVDGRHPWHEGYHSGMLWATDGTGYEGRHPEQDLIAEWTDEPEQGTLKELNVQPGDVVEYTAIGEPQFKPKIYTFGCWSNGYPYAQEHVVGGEENLRTDDDAVFRIISRASQSTTPPPNVATPETGLTPTPLSHSTTPPSPVRTITRKEIVSGVYGRVMAERLDNGDWCFEVKSMRTASDLTQAIQTLTEIRDALESA